MGQTVICMIGGSVVGASGESVVCGWSVRRQSVWQSMVVGLVFGSVVESVRWRIGLLVGQLVSCSDGQSIGRSFDGSFSGSVDGSLDWSIGQSRDHIWLTQTSANVCSFGPKLTRKFHSKAAPANTDLKPMHGNYFKYCIF